MNPTNSTELKVTEKKLVLKRDTLRSLGVAPSANVPGGDQITGHHSTIGCTMSGTGHMCC
ncbi:MAG: hypothetical protein ACHREM_17430 [Polyangiales bacterium]